MAEEKNDQLQIEITLYNSTKDVKTYEEIFELGIEHIDFFKIIENKLGEFVKRNGKHFSVVHPDYKIYCGTTAMPTDCIVAEIYGEKGLYDLIVLAKENDWKLFDRQKYFFVDITASVEESILAYKKRLDVFWECSGGISLYNCQQEVNSYREIEALELAPTDFFEIIEAKLGALVDKKDDLFYLIGPEFRVVGSYIYGFGESKKSRNISILGEKGFYEIILIAKENGWKLYDYRKDYFLDMNASVEECILAYKQRENIDISIKR